MAHTTYAQLLSELASYWWPIVVDAAVKGLAILLLTFLAALLMRRASAAARHLLWRLTMIGLLALPLISTALPAWNVLPDWFNPPRPRSIAPVQVLANVDVVERVPTEHAKLAPSRTVTVLPLAVDVPRPEVMPNSVASGGGTAQRHDGIDLAGWLLVIWSLGVIASISPLFLGMFSLWRLGRRSRQVTDGPWHALLTEVSLSIGLKRPVALLLSARRSVPMVWGDWPLGRTTLLLPEVAKDWSQQRLRVVLLHELAHIQRHDCLAHLVTHFACALYWFNPLIWLAAWRMQVERERACDDVVVAGGSEPSDYAEQLLHIAADLRGNLLCGSAAIAMARRSNLESRLLAILDEHRNRRTLTRFAVVAAVALLGAVVVPVAMLQAGEDTGESEPGNKEAAESPTDDKSFFTKLPNDATVERLGAEVFGQVILADDQPAADVPILVFMSWSRSSVEDGKRIELARRRRKTLEKGASPGPDMRGHRAPQIPPRFDGTGVGMEYPTTTDAQGWFRCYMKRRAPYRDFDEAINIFIFARQTDHAMGLLKVIKTTTIDPPLDPIYLKLVSTGTAEFTVINPEDAPISTASLSASMMMLGYMLFPDVPAEARPRFQHLGEGRYRATGLIPDLAYSFHATAEGCRSENRLGVVVRPGQHLDAGIFKLAWAGRKAVPSWIERLNSLDVYEREHAARRLGKIGPDAIEAVPALIERLNNDPKNTVRYTAAEALGNIGSDAKAAVPHLIRALLNDEHGVPREAATALGRIGDASALAALRQALKIDDRTVRNATEESIRMLENLQAASLGQSLLLGCIMYATDHDGKWPDDLSALGPYLDGDPTSGWVYIKPSMPHGKLPRASETLIIYQAFEQWQGGVYAGFADGHVALIADEDRFKQLLTVVRDREE